MGYAHTMKSRRHIARLIAGQRSCRRHRTRRDPAGALAGCPGSGAVRARLCGGGEFHPLTPARIFDSRPGSPINDVAPLGAKPLGVPSRRPSTSRSSARAAFPADAGQRARRRRQHHRHRAGAKRLPRGVRQGREPAHAPPSSTSGPDQTVPNVAIVRPGTDGQLTIGLFGQSGTRQRPRRRVRLVLHQHLHRGTDGARLIPTTPSRILDTRDGSHRPSGGRRARAEADDATCRSSAPMVSTRQCTDVVPASGTSPACC